MEIKTTGLKYNFNTTGQVESVDVTLSGSSAEEGSVSAIVRIVEENMETLTKPDFEAKAREKLKQWIQQSVDTDNYESEQL
ncbi:hypothetical protein NGC25_00020 [Enterococcus faecalis]|uniref:hypothetical protein n=1 Tax=Enterococcus faecalis TaxID=1351 RepID=UPI002DB7A23B|nr:hypothetical protein [Enterococcus faecalis]MEB7425660.1 hypothetical protein [Enterococcus faecalis]